MTTRETNIWTGNKSGWSGFKSWGTADQDVSDEAQIRDIVALIRVVLWSAAVGLPLGLVIAWLR